MATTLIRGVADWGCGFPWSGLLWWWSCSLGKGLVMVYSILEGKFTQQVAETVAARRSLKQRMQDNKIKGFCRVIASPSVSQGLTDVYEPSFLFEWNQYPYYLPLFLSPSGCRRQGWEA